MSIGPRDIPPESFPEGLALEITCNPFGNLAFSLLLADDDRDEPNEIERSRYVWLINNWEQAWSSASNALAQAIKDYEIGTPLNELLKNPRNTLFLSLGEGGIDPDSNWGITLDIGLPEGSHQFSCEMADFVVVRTDAAF